MENYIGLNIKYLCDKNMLNQKEFGELFGLTQSAVNVYIRKKSNPQVETLQKIAIHFGITLDDLINKQLSENVFTAKNTAEKKHSDVDIKILKIMEDALIDKQKIIEGLELELSKYKTAEVRNKAV